MMALRFPKHLLRFFPEFVTPQFYHSQICYQRGVGQPPKEKTLELDTVMVTGAARGIGLEFVRQLVRLPKPPQIIFATYRDENTLMDHFVEGQWVFGGVERETGHCLLVAVHDRTAETLLCLIESLIEPGTTVISDCWKSYERLSERGYYHLTVNHSLEFVDSETGAHTNTIEVTWRHFKASLPEYNRKGRFEGYIAWYIFWKICFTLKEDPFIKFLELVRNINWAEWRIVSGGGVEESNS
ncbi:putative transposase-like protein [Trichonephila clavipes]|nr:putative transposase-like protein [Trichonephila clavipes]